MMHTPTPILSPAEAYLVAEWQRISASGSLRDRQQWFSRAAQFLNETANKAHWWCCHPQVTEALSEVLVYHDAQPVVQDLYCTMSTQMGGCSNCINAYHAAQDRFRAACDPSQAGGSAASTLLLQLQRLDEQRIVSWLAVANSITAQQELPQQLLCGLFEALSQPPLLRLPAVAEAVTSSLLLLARTHDLALDEAGRFPGLYYLLSHPDVNVRALVAPSVHRLGTFSTWAEVEEAQVDSLLQGWVAALPQHNDNIWIGLKTVLQCLEVPILAQALQCVPGLMQAILSACSPPFNTAYRHALGCLLLLLRRLRLQALKPLRPQLHAAHGVEQTVASLVTALIDGCQSVVDVSLHKLLVDVTCCLLECLLLEPPLSKSPPDTATPTAATSSAPTPHSSFSSHTHSMVHTHKWQQESRRLLYFLIVQVYCNGSTFAPLVRQTAVLGSLTALEAAVQSVGRPPPADAHIVGDAVLRIVMMSMPGAGLESRLHEQAARLVCMALQADATTLAVCLDPSRLQSQSGQHSPQTLSTASEQHQRVCPAVATDLNACQALTAALTHSTQYGCCPALWRGIVGCSHPAVAATLLAAAAYICCIDPDVSSSDASTRVPTEDLAVVEEREADRALGYTPHARSLPREVEGAMQLGACPSMEVAVGEGWNGAGGCVLVHRCPRILSGMFRQATEEQLWRCVQAQHVLGIASDRLQPSLHHHHPHHHHHHQHPHQNQAPPPHPLEVSALTSCFRMTASVHAGLRSAASQALLSHCKAQRPSTPEAMAAALAEAVAAVLLPQPRVAAAFVRAAGQLLHELVQPGCPQVLQHVQLQHGLPTLQLLLRAAGDHDALLPHIQRLSVSLWDLLMGCVQQGRALAQAPQVQKALPVLLDLIPTTWYYLLLPTPTATSDLDQDAEVRQGTDSSITGTNGSGTNGGQSARDVHSPDAASRTIADAKRGLWLADVLAWGPLLQPAAAKAWMSALELVLPMAKDLTDNVLPKAVIAAAKSVLAMDSGLPDPIRLQLSELLPEAAPGNLGSLSKPTLLSSLPSRDTAAAAAAGHTGPAPPASAVAAAAAKPLPTATKPAKDTPEVVDLLSDDEGDDVPIADLVEQQSLQARLQRRQQQQQSKSPGGTLESSPERSKQATLAASFQTFKRPTAQAKAASAAGAATSRPEADDDPHDGFPLAERLKLLRSALNFKTSGAPGRTGRTSNKGSSAEPLHFADGLWALDRLAGALPDHASAVNPSHGGGSSSGSHRRHHHNPYSNAYSGSHSGQHESSALGSAAGFKKKLPGAANALLSEIHAKTSDRAGTGGGSSGGGGGGHGGALRIHGHHAPSMTNHPTRPSPPPIYPSHGDHRHSDDGKAPPQTHVPPPKRPASPPRMPLALDMDDLFSFPSMHGDAGSERSGPAPGLVPGRMRVSLLSALADSARPHRQTVQLDATGKNRIGGGNKAPTKAAAPPKPTLKMEELHKEILGWDLKTVLQPSSTTAGRSGMSGGGRPAFGAGATGGGLRQPHTAGTDVHSPGASSTVVSGAACGVARQLKSAGAPGAAGKLQSVPLRFNGLEHYTRIFRPLLMDELQAGIRGSVEELAAGAAQLTSCIVSVAEVLRTDGESHTITFHVDPGGSSSRQHSSNAGYEGPRSDDLVLLTRRSMAGKTSDLTGAAAPATSLLLLVTESSMDQGVRILQTKACFDASCVSAAASADGASAPPTVRKISELLLLRSTWHMSILHSLVPSFRELQALCHVSSLPVRLRTFLLDPRQTPTESSRPQHASHAGPGSSTPGFASLSQAVGSSSQGLRLPSQDATAAAAAWDTCPAPAAMKWAMEGSYNNSQLAAVASALDPDAPISLVQGPPGSGKTSAIVGILSMLLAGHHIQQKVQQRSGLEATAAALSSRVSAAVAKGLLPGGKQRGSGCSDGAAAAGGGPGKGQKRPSAAKRARSPSPATGATAGGDAELGNCGTAAAGHGLAVPVRKQAIQADGSNTSAAAGGGGRSKRVRKHGNKEVTGDDSDGQVGDDGSKEGSGAAAEDAFKLGVAPPVRVLVCAQSNAAIDELMVRLSAEGIWDPGGLRRQAAMVRMGRSDVTHGSVLAHHVDSLAEALGGDKGAAAAAMDHSDSARRQAGEARAALASVNEDMARLTAQQQAATTTTAAAATTEGAPAVITKDIWGDVSNVGSDMSLNGSDEDGEEHSTGTDSHHGSKRKRRAGGHLRSSTLTTAGTGAGETAAAAAGGGGDDGEVASAAARQAASALAVELRGLRERRAALTSQLKAAERGVRTGAQELARAKREMRAAVASAAEIVVCTLSSAGGDLLSAWPPASWCAGQAPRFDALVIDEAAQALEPAALIPLQLLQPGGKVMLVGDPLQLPPTVLSRAADTARLSQSLFERLQRAGCSCSLLTEQYRMHPAISRFPSSFFYRNQLLDGEGINATTRGAPFHTHALLAPLVVWDCVEGRERAGGAGRGGSLQNRAEAELAAALYAGMRSAFPAFSGTVAVITPYKAQISALIAAFRAVAPQASQPASLQASGTNARGSGRGGRGGDNGAAVAGVEFGTVDGMQGREADVVIFSCVRARQIANIGGGGAAGAPPAAVTVGFLSDVRRMNVGLTRAKRSLWVVGHAATLASSPPWAALLKHATNQQCMYRAVGAPSRLLSTPPAQLRVTDMDAVAVMGAGGSPGFGAVAAVPKSVHELPAVFLVNPAASALAAKDGNESAGAATRDAVSRQMLPPPPRKRPLEGADSPEAPTTATDQAASLNAAPIVAVAGARPLKRPSAAARTPAAAADAGGAVLAAATGGGTAAVAASTHNGKPPLPPARTAVAAVAKLSAADSHSMGKSAATERQVADARPAHNTAHAPPVTEAGASTAAQPPRFKRPGASQRAQPSPAHAAVPHALAAADASAAAQLARVPPPPAANEHSHTSTAARLPSATRSDGGSGTSHDSKTVAQQRPSRFSALPSDVQHEPNSRLRTEQQKAAGTSSAARQHIAMEDPQRGSTAGETAGAATHFQKEEQHRRMHGTHKIQRAQQDVGVSGGSAEHPSKDTARHTHHSSTGSDKHGVGCELTGRQDGRMHVSDHRGKEPSGHGMETAMQDSHGLHGKHHRDNSHAVLDEKHRQNSHSKAGRHEGHSKAQLEHQQDGRHGHDSRQRKHDGDKDGSGHDAGRRGEKHHADHHRQHGSGRRAGKHDAEHHARHGIDDRGGHIKGSKHSHDSKGHAQHSEQHHKEVAVVKPLVPPVAEGPSSWVGSGAKTVTRLAPKY